MSETTIFEVTEAKSEYVDAVCRLLRQLSSTPHTFTADDLQRMVADEGTHLFLLQADGGIVGMMTLCSTLAPTGRKMWVEDVVVDASMRGRSLGRTLIEYATDYARSNGNVTLMLTSRPSRVAANALYRSSGFTQKETNVYIIKGEP